ncbi:MAG TPA: hypothetical protein VK738_04375 [Terriglobales bacterium]|nr:hypothetical protein [Terriglobales bacterium]
MMAPLFWNQGPANQQSGPLPSYYPPPGQLYGTDPALLNIAMRRYLLNQQKQAQPGMGASGNPLWQPATMTSAPAPLGRLGPGGLERPLGLGTQSQQGTRLGSGFFQTPASGQRVLDGQTNLGQNANGGFGGWNPQPISSRPLPLAGPSDWNGIPSGPLARNVNGGVGGNGSGGLGLTPAYRTTQAPAYPTTQAPSTFNDPVTAIRQRAALQTLRGLYGFGGLTDQELNRLAARYGYASNGMGGQPTQTSNALASSAQYRPASLSASNGQPMATTTAQNQQGHHRQFQHPINYLSPPLAPAPPGVNQSAWKESVRQYQANRGNDVPAAPYPLHGWELVSAEDRKKLGNMMSSGNRAGANAYAKEVAEKAYRDHPVEKWLPYGPNLPSTRESVRDVDNLEHSGEWAHVSPQERSNLAALLAKGQVDEANQYARKLNSDVQVRLAKRSLDARPEPPSLAPEFWDTAKINKLRGYQAANIIANEDRDVLPGPSTPEDLQKARVAQAHAIINADRNLGDARQGLVGTAPSEIKDRKFANSEQYRQALNAVRTSREEDLRGIDPTGDRMPFNNRYNTLDKGKRKIGSESVNLHQPYGPFVWGKTPTYVMLYDNTQDELRRIERMKKKEKK